MTSSRPTSLPDPDSDYDSDVEQLQLFVEPSEALEDTSLWTPREIWVRLNQRYLESLSEDKRLERKNPSKVNFDSFAEYLSAFSNTVDGGVMVFGVEDRGAITGVLFDEAQISKLESAHRSRCPLARPEFRRVQVVVNGRPTYCLAVYIPYVGVLVETSKAEAWIRYGDQKHKMSPEECLDFRTTRAEVPFDLRPAVGVRYPDDFDMRIVQDFCDSFRASEMRPAWTNDEVLDDRLLFRQVDGRRYATNALILLAGKRPDVHLPGCRLRVLRFDGFVEGEGITYRPIKDVVIEGNVVSILTKAFEIIPSILFDVTWLDDSGKFVTTPEYPPLAWQEAVVNALVHRSYAFSGTEVTMKVFRDRMEIESPGGFMPPVTAKNIYKTRASRNHHFMDALRILGYVRMAREGTRRMKETMSGYKLPEPSFRQESLNGVVVRVTLKNDMDSRKRSTERDVAAHFGVDLWAALSPVELEVAAYLFNNKEVQVAEIERLTGKTWRSSKRILDGLVEKGVAVYRPGKFNRDPKSGYRIK